MTTAILLMVWCAVAAPTDCRIVEPQAHPSLVDCWAAGESLRNVSGHIGDVPARIAAVSWRARQ